MTDTEIHPAYTLDPPARAGWRFICDRCGYRTLILGARGVTLASRVHRHRHVVGIL